MQAVQRRGERGQDQGRVVSAVHAGHTDRPEGTQCRGGVCVPIVMCTKQSDCGSRQACVDGRCECAGDCNSHGRGIRQRGRDHDCDLRRTATGQRLSRGGRQRGPQVFANEVSTVIANFGLGCPGVQ